MDTEIKHTHKHYIMLVIVFLRGGNGGRGNDWWFSLMVLTRLLKWCWS